MKFFFRKGKRTVKAEKAKIVIYQLIPVKRVTTVQTAMMTMDRKQTMPKQRKMKTMKRKRRQS